VLGLAVEYHLSVSAAVFDGILDEADYLMQKGYLRAAAVLIGAALEEGLKNRARAAGLEVGSKHTLSPVIAKLRAPEVHEGGPGHDFGVIRWRAPGELRPALSQ
jgi:hypothetical protein